MQIKATQNGASTLIEILADNGNPASPANPIAATEYASVEFPEVSGNLAIVSGMPMSAVCLVALHYKNMFSAIAVANPKRQCAEVIHSVTASYSVGGDIPLG